MRVFLDANVLFSAADEHSATRRLVKMVAARAGLVTGDHVLEEARRNLQLKRPALTAGLDALMKEIEISRAFAVVDIDLPSKDIPVLAGAIGARCTHLWTGDRHHFGRYCGKTIHGVTVQSAIEMLELVQ